MKKFCSIVMLGILSILAANAKVSTNTPIFAPVSSATVFFDGAEVMHNVHLTLNKGINDIYIRGLSRGIEDQSLHLKLPQGVSIVSLNLKSSDLSESKHLPASLQQLKDSVDFYQSKQNLLNGELAVDSSLVRQLEKSSVAGLSVAAKTSVTSSIDSKMNQYRTQAMRLYQRISDAKFKMMSINRSLSYFESKYQSKFDEYHGFSKMLHLTLMSEVGGAFSSELYYFTSFASWKPFYDLNVISQDKPVTIVYNAKITQSTGVSWNNIRISLSSGYPDSYKAAPDLETWFMGYANRSPLYSNMVAMADANSISMMKQSAFDRLSSGIARIDSNESTDLLARINKKYTIELPYSIEGNGDAQIIKLQTKQTAASFSYYSVPRLDQNVYLVAKLNDWQKLGLIGGMMNLSYQNTYVGQVLLNIGNLAQDRGITLGSMGQITVSRMKQKDFGTQSFLGNTVKQLFGYHSSFTNTSDKMVSVDVYEQYPISKDDGIGIELMDKQTTSFTSNNEQKGIVKWTLNLNPGETKGLDFVYSVKYPKGKRPNGLPD